MASPPRNSGNDARELVLRDFDDVGRVGLLLVMRRDIVAGVLLERDEQLGQLDAATHGGGSVVVDSGVAGVGKTVLLQEAGERARSRGLAVLSARGKEWSAISGHGLKRQLLERSPLTPRRQPDAPMISLRTPFIHPARR